MLLRYLQLTVAFQFQDVSNLFLIEASIFFHLVKQLCRRYYLCVPFLANPLKSTALFHHYQDFDT